MSEGSPVPKVTLSSQILNGHSLTDQGSTYRYNAGRAAKKSIDQILNLLALLCESGDERPLSYGALSPIIWTIGPPSVICDILIIKVDFVCDTKIHPTIS